MLRRDDLDGLDRPAQRASENYMRSVLAYRIQERAGPRLSKATKRELERIARSLEKGETPKATPQLKAGTKLIREWNGVMHEVLILDDGFEHRDRTYASLSAVAKQITGAHWSGPRFFGLTSRSKNDGG